MQLITYIPCHDIGLLVLLVFVFSKFPIDQRLEELLDLYYLHNTIQIYFHYYKYCLKKSVFLQEIVFHFLFDSKNHCSIDKTKVVYICSNWLQLTVESHDSTEAETNKTAILPFCKDWANSQNDNYFSLNIIQGSFHMTAEILSKWAQILSGFRLGYFR